MSAGRKPGPHGQVDPLLADLMTYADATRRTREDIAGEMGVSGTAYSHLRRGGNPTWETLRLLLDTLGLDVKLVLK